MDNALSMCVSTWEVRVARVIDEEAVSIVDVQEGWTIGISEVLCGEDLLRRSVRNDAA